jgi:hypothetical protein
MRFMVLMMVKICWSTVGNMLQDNTAMQHRQIHQQIFILKTHRVIFHFHCSRGTYNLRGIIRRYINIPYMTLQTTLLFLRVLTCSSQMKPLKKYRCSRC